MKRTNLTEKEQQYMDDNSPTIKVKVIDVAKLAAEIAPQLIEQHPHLKDCKFHITAAAFIEGSNVLLDNECVSVHDNKSLPMTIRRSAEKDPNSTTTHHFPFAIWDFELPVSSISKYLAEEAISLKEFMADRYDYNPRIRANTLELINELNTVTA